MPSFESFWELVAILGSLITIAGVVAEESERALKFTKRKLFWKLFIWHRKDRLAMARLLWFLHKKRVFFEDLGFAFVFIGLAIELGAGTKALLISHAEDRRLRGDLATLNDRASSNELAAIQLGIELNKTKTELATAQARLNESITNLENANLPMDIGEQGSFAEDLKPFAGMQIELRSAADTKSQKTADLLNTVFIRAGWKVMNRGVIPNIGEDGVIIGYNVGIAFPLLTNAPVVNPDRKAGHLLLKLLTERGVPAEIIENHPGSRRVLVPSNTIILAVCERPNQLKVELMQLEAKDEIAEDNWNTQAPTLFARMTELQTNRYVSNSKELADAQTEFNDLNIRLLKLRIEETNNFDRERKLYKQMDEVAGGTNSHALGIHMSGNVFNGFDGNMDRFIKIGNGTNSPPIFMN